MDVWVATIGSIALALWLVMLLTERKTGAEQRLFTWAFCALAAFTVISHHGMRIPEALTGERIHTWNQYHYYVGSKYFAELGYFDLYAATLTADDDFIAAGGEPGEGFAHVERSRDMHSYKVRPRAEVVAGWDRSTFEPERLAELGEDSRWIRSHMDDSKVQRMMMDLGYNPAPPWTLLGVPLTHIVDLGGPLYPLITASDVFVHVLVIGVLLWAFGLRTAAIATVWLHAMPVNLGRMTGAFFTYDWLGAAVLAWGAWHKERPRLAGIALSWAAMTRVFPGLIALPIVARTAWPLLRGERPDPKRLAFTVAFCGACTLLLVGSHFTGRGADTWPEWKSKISMHSTMHAITGSQRIGLPRLARHEPSEKRFWRVPRKPGEAGKSRIQAIKRGGLLLGVALLVVASWRRSDSEAMLLMLFAAWLATTSSRYYASIWVLLFTLPRARAPGAFAGTVLLGMLVWFNLPESETGKYLLLNYEAGFLFVVLCGLFLRASRIDRVSDPVAGSSSDGGS